MGESNCKRPSNLAVAAVRLLSRRHGNQTLYLHVFVSDEEGNELPLHQVRRLTTYMVPGERCCSRKLQRFSHDTTALCWNGTHAG